ncbi:uncharacterized protein CMU_042130 [Cryptosporidium muris RN66]|uniref:Uncharacterized protein n=1 Tax=Cryptosporidium muris (strain RN66) TaxID=441375 RepID=B6AA99_CRYMR|nr:uncharacterized protein CMU_042130 [Cryptosporidium muris RN66]EEA05140.1 hypothetical protein CMU_042130 [Cryptosporidium muris RN66]|eukprot:XP_002139489.1 hypothetical protein [Cryptosporidium muris RN66]
MEKFSDAITYLNKKINHIEEEIHILDAKKHQLDLQKQDIEGKVKINNNKSEIIDKFEIYLTKISAFRLSNNDEKFNLLLEKVKMSMIQYGSKRFSYYKYNIIKQWHLIYCTHCKDAEGNLYCKIVESIKLYDSMNQPCYIIDITDIYKSCIIEVYNQIRNPLIEFDFSKSLEEFVTFIINIEKDYPEIYCKLHIHKYLYQIIFPFIYLEMLSWDPLHLIKESKELEENILNSELLKNKNIIEWNNNFSIESFKWYNFILRMLNMTSESYIEYNDQQTKTDINIMNISKFSSIIYDGIEFIFTNYICEIITNIWIPLNIEETNDIISSISIIFSIIPDQQLPKYKTSLKILLLQKFILCFKELIFPVSDLQFDSLYDDLNDSDYNFLLHLLSWCISLSNFGNIISDAEKKDLLNITIIHMIDYLKNTQITSNTSTHVYKILYMKLPEMIQSTIAIL